MNNNYWLEHDYDAAVAAVDDDDDDDDSVDYVDIIVQVPPVDVATVALTTPYHPDACVLPSNRTTPEVMMHCHMM